ncbi:MAG: 16S rRNA (guanine(527)-N(7))-methyltransferase RsmG [Cyanobacteria bacterium SBLK]|nr:16S rRNA (guanine(527)-N(7))-methyltransferase RsmG [Cyanobacteria bacterium SBLK]
MTQKYLDLAIVRNILSTPNWQPGEEHLQKFQQLYMQIINKNKRGNLTRITEPQEFLEKHLWDAIAGIKPLKILGKEEETKTAIDIGTGGGFPGIPIAIACPNYQVTLLDSVRKKMLLLDEIITALNLQNVKILSGRAEEIGQDLNQRESCDLAAIRAVGLPSVCAEYSLPFLKLGGIAILYRGQWSAEETKSLSLAAKKLGGEIKEIASLQTPLSKSIRHCIYLEKKEPTPAQYPRRVGIPTKKPL